MVVTTSDATLVVQYTKDKALKVSKPVRHGIESSCVLPELLAAVVLEKVKGFASESTNGELWPMPGDVPDDPESLPATDPQTNTVPSTRPVAVH
ncbi:hypothetical protein I316_06564 [Kwoniella heveanensis BCC8398]|uniref:Uncharacterized protein n=1 Tax=Kwoniella heveanensis BCC8398 TaxID=1296120 RepID=A0A1B9GL78_9TREE|nr:hypothetical protein I316_06564 [Kwoniella heveanensis BCC8398]